MLLYDLGQSASPSVLPAVEVYCSNRRVVCHSSGLSPRVEEGGGHVEPQASQYRRSIFAETLAEVVGAHGKQLVELTHVPISLETRRVTRLVISLRSSANMPGLNPGEINSIVFGLRLTDNERLRIYAGLIALGSQRELLYYLSEDRAWQIAMQVRESTYQWLLDQRNKGSDPTRRWHGTTEDLEDVQDGQVGALAPALDAFDEGTRLQALAALSSDGEIERLRLEEALFHFTRAARLLDMLAPSVRAAEEWAFWRHAVSTAQIDVRDQLE